MSQPGRSGRLRAFLASYWTPAGRQAFRNLVGLVVCTGLSQACALAVLLILTHGLSQAAFGAVIFALNLQTYLFAVGTFGLTTLVVRDLTQQPEQADGTATAFLSIAGVASVVTGLLTAAVAAVLPVSWDERVMLWCVAAGNVAACLNLNSLFDAAHRQALAAALTVPGDVLAVGVVAGLYAVESLSVPVVGFVMLGKWTVTAVLQWLALGQAVRPLRWSPDRACVRRLLRSGWPILLAGLLYMVPLQGGVIAIRLHQGEAATAVYGLAVQAAVLYLTLSWLVTRVLQPHITGPYGLDRVFVLKLIAACAMLFGGLWAVGVASGWVLTQYILPEDYREAFGPVILLLTAALFTTPARVANAYLARFGREGVVAWIYGVAAAGFVAAVVALAPASPGQFGALVVVAVAVQAVASVSCAVASARPASAPHSPTGTNR